VPINISVKNVPDDVIEKLRQRAKRHHRSLQGELMAIIEEAAGPGKISLEEAELSLRSLGFGTEDDSTAWIRELRDER
jgi:plasmid stability protein